MAAHCRHWVNATHQPAANAIVHQTPQWEETGEPTSGHLLHQQHSWLCNLVATRSQAPVVGGY